MSLCSQLGSHVRSACYRPYMNSPTVTHEPGLSTAYENENHEAIFSRIPHARLCTTTHENEEVVGYAEQTMSLHSRRGYAGAPCPQ